MQKADAISHVGLSNHCRQRPTLPHSFPCSTIGGIRLNFRVRNGKGCDPDPMTTGILCAWGPAFARVASFGAQAFFRLARRSAVGGESGVFPTISKRKW